MKSHIVINGNAFYEIDEECLRKQEQERKKQQVKREGMRENACSQKGGGVQKNRFG